MKSKEFEQFNEMLFTLRRIKGYLPPEKLRKVAEKLYGLTYQEGLIMAYENIIEEARNCTRHIKQKKIKA